MTANDVERGRTLALSGKYTVAAVPQPNGADLYADVPPSDEPPDDGDRADDQPTTWEPVDLGPWLRGEVEQSEPSCGVARSDGLRLIYPGREHAILGETESGKTWLALMCVAAELSADNTVVYVHYEEGNPASTIERLRLLQVPVTAIAARLRFVAPARPARTEWVVELSSPAPSLVVHDGVNEAMALHGADIMAAEGAATFRRRIVTPFIKAGAAVIACDHLPKNSDGRRDAYGSVHKGNALDGARIVLENTAPFGRRMRGVSHVFITKDRPGQLRAHGKPSKTPGKTFMGTLAVDDAQSTSPEFIAAFYAPVADDVAPAHDPRSDDRETVFSTVAEMPHRTIASKRALRARLRLADAGIRNTRIDDLVDELVASGRFAEVPGKRGACGYQAVSTGSQGDECPGVPRPVPVTGSHTGSLKRGEPVGTSHQPTGSDCREPVGTGGNRSSEDGESGDD